MIDLDLIDPVMTMDDLLTNLQTLKEAYQKQYLHIGDLEETIGDLEDELHYIEQENDMELMKQLAIVAKERIVSDEYAMVKLACESVLSGDLKTAKRELNALFTTYPELNHA